MSSALAIFSDPKVKAEGDRLLVIQKAAAAEVGYIEKMEQEAALRALLVGSQLQVIKCSMPYGTWGGWFADEMEGLSRRSATYYMKLADIFAATSTSDANQAAQLTFEEIWNNLTRIDETITKTERIALLKDAKQLKDIEDKLRDLRAKVADRRKNLRAVAV